MIRRQLLNNTTPYQEILRKFPNQRGETFGKQLRMFPSLQKMMIEGLLSSKGNISTFRLTDDHDGVSYLEMV